MIEEEVGFGHCVGGGGESWYAERISSTTEVAAEERAYCNKGARVQTGMQL